MITCTYIPWHTPWNEGLNSSSYVVVVIVLIKKQFMVRIVNWHHEQYLVDGSDLLFSVISRKLQGTRNTTLKDRIKIKCDRYKHRPKAML